MQCSNLARITGVSAVIQINGRPKRISSYARWRKQQRAEG